MRDHDGIEFLDAEPGDGPDEELTQPVGFPRLRRARLPLLVAGAVGLLAIVAVNVVQGPKGTPAAGPATVTASPSPTRTTPTIPSNRLVIMLPSNGKVALSGRDLTCPAATSCQVRLETPDAVRAAVHHALPGAKHLRTVTVARTDVPGSPLSLRRITGRVGPARLSISIRPAHDDDRLGWNAAETASRTVATVDDHVGPRLISLRLSAPPGYPLDILAVRRLAADQRLATHS